MRKFLRVFMIVMVFIIALFCSFFALFYLFYKPELLLNGSEFISLGINQDYQEDGARAFIFNREVDGVIVRGKVDNTKVGTYELQYIYNPKFLNNMVIKIRTIKVTDSDAPSIKLDGENELSIYVGSKYSDPGFKASDAYDGDLTDKVIVNNKVEENKIGTYEIIYEVSDSSGNKTSAKRIVKVIARPTTTTTSKDKNGDNTLSSGTGTGTGRGLPILMYHFFYDETLGEVGIDNNYMEIHAFEEQMKYLDENDYYFPSWQEVADFVDGKITLPEKSVVVTIDDGHRSFFRLAVSVIEKYDIKVTSFLITSRLSDRSFTYLKSSKLNFESHTHDMHRGGCTGGSNGLFRCINYDLGLEDLNKSISILGSNEAIAYPYGDVTNNVLSITKAANFKVGVTTKYGKAKKGMDRYQLPRVRMYKGMSLERFKQSL